MTDPGQNQRRLSQWTFRRAGWVLCLLLWGCNASEPDIGKPVIAASIWPLAAVAHQLAQGEADVVCLVPPGQSPHGFEMTGSQLKSISRAKIVLAVGMGFDGWVDQTLKQHGRKDVQALHLADFLEAEAVPSEKSGQEKPEAAGTQKHDPHHGHSHGHGHDHEGPNAHLWLDPLFMMEMIGRLEEALIRRLPDSTAAIRMRAQGLRDELEAVDQEYIRQLEKHRGAKIVTFHNAFDLLLEHYGLEVAATLMPDDTPGALTQARVKSAKEIISRFHVRALFAEPQFMEVGRRLSEETGLPVLVLDPLGGPQMPGRSSYPELLRYNLKILLEGLSPSADIQPVVPPG